MVSWRCRFQQSLIHRVGDRVEQYDPETNGFYCSRVCEVHKDKGLVSYLIIRDVGNDWPNSFNPVLDKAKLVEFEKDWRARSTVTEWCEAAYVFPARDAEPGQTFRLGELVEIRDTDKSTCGYCHWFTATIDGFCGDYGGVVVCARVQLF